MMLDFPSTAVNREAISAVLKDVFPPEQSLRVLELASGSGQHAVYFAGLFPAWSIQPTDFNAEHLSSIEEYRVDSGLPNVLPALALDVSASPWPVSAKFQAIWAINLIHISPWATTLGLFDGAARVLGPGGKVYLYGAYRRGGSHTAPSNEAFDRSLQQSDPRWGVRCLDEVAAVAKQNGFELDRVVEMPSNNLSVVFELGRD